jgi:hypothetical protein
MYPKQSTEQLPAIHSIVRSVFQPLRSASRPGTSMFLLPLFAFSQGDEEALHPPEEPTESLSRRQEGDRRLEKKRVRARAYQQ